MVDELRMDWASFDPVAFRTAYERDGYAIVRNVFSPTEVAEMKARFDAWRAEMLASHHATYVKGNLRVWVSEGAAGSEGVKQRGFQKALLAARASYSDEVLNRYRQDPKMFEIASALIGRNIKQIINQMHWKMP